ncbi:MAG: hypothetical protein O2962_05455, partial [Cyanobacteria bacterium]|nr:hypothetical protein [Cyanobacteriota bacterium]
IHKMDSSQLNISFVSNLEFATLPGVQAGTLEFTPKADADFLKECDAEDSIIKDRSQGDKSPTYTAGAQACTAGFLRVRVGMKPSSDIMFHLFGVRGDRLDDPTVKVEREFREKMQEYFTNIDDIIRLAKAKGEDIHIDYVTAGSLERSQGQSPPGAEPIDEVMKHSKGVRKAVETILVEQTQAFKDRASEQGVKTTIASSKFANQQSMLNSKIPITPKTNLYFDGKNTLYINAAMAEEQEGKQNYISDATSAEEIKLHYANIKVSENHSVPQLAKTINATQSA